MREIKVGDEFLYTTVYGSKYKFLITNISSNEVDFVYTGITKGDSPVATHWALEAFLDYIKNGSLVFCNKISIEDDPEYSGLFI